MKFITGFAITVIVLGLFGFLFMLLDAVKLRRLRKKYNEKEDKSKQGEHRRKAKTRETGADRGLGQLLTGEDSTSTGKDSKSKRKRNRIIAGRIRRIRRRRR